MSGMLKNLIKNISSWSELEDGIAGLPTEHDRGYAFEEFCHAFFILDPVFQFKAVYSQNEIPASILKRLGYPGRKDIGIDGVAISNDNKITAYQAKFRRDRTNTPTLRELSTFFTMSDRADWRITITNANKLPSAVHDRTRQNCILSDSFFQLNPDFFKRLRIWLSKKTKAPTKKITPHKTQREAINAALKHFKDNSRGQMILPCGTGKTLAAMWIVEKLGGRRILVMVPSLALLSQTLREWAENTSLRPFRYLCLCSDTTVDLENDSPVEHIYEMKVQVTTDSDIVAEFLKKNTKTTSILFSTYQSSKVLSEATLKSGIRFDTAIFDEAHRTAGTQASIWSLALDDKNVPTKKRLFMTATPRIYAPHITKKAKDEDILLCSMDDHTVYGETIYKITFGQAIERDLITDYKVVVICITDAEVRKLVKEGSRVITTDNREWDAKALAKRLALAKALDAYGFKKIFTFHGKVSGAKAFTDTESPYGIKQVIEMVDAKKHKQDKIEYFHVNGTMSSGDRKARLEEFKEAEIGIMSNARCLTEGVDIPAVDAIAFIDPKKSLIDIVQATGRAMRKAEGKNKGYIFVPVVVGEDDDPEEFLVSSDFKTVWQILQAMVEQDQHLEDEVSKLRVLQGKGEVGSKEWKAAMAEYSEKFEFFNLPGKINVARFTESLYTKAIEVIAKSWDFWYGLTLKYKQEFGDANTPLRYKTSDGFSLGRWQSSQKSYYKKGKLESERIKQLEDIGLVWDQLEEAWGKGYQETLKYKKQFGNANAPAKYKTPDGFSLGKWQSHQKVAYCKGKLDSEEIKRLEETGFIWDKFDEAWEMGYQETLKYKHQFGDTSTPQRYKAPNGFNLGRWQHNQRTYYKMGKLEKTRFKRLENIGFVWDPLDKAWGKGYQETLKHKNQFGGANAPDNYKTTAGFRLSIWQKTQRENYNKGKLDNARIKRLENIDFVWVILDDAWERGYQETIKYKQQFGNANVPRRYTTSDGFNLGTWQGTQKGNYNKGKLDKEKTERLEEVGFIWHELGEAWERGYQETIKYKQQFGKANVSQGYRTSDGFKLSIWQNNQKGNYNNGTLGNERLRRLEEIGFVWDVFEDAWGKGYQETVKYKQQFGNANAPNRYKTPEGFYLGSWQQHQKGNYKKEELNKEKIKRLEDIGFVWDPLDDAWERGYQETVKLKQQFGNPNALQKYKTPDGFKLGWWQGTQKAAYNKGKLDKARIKRLEMIGFAWDQLEDAWENGYHETLKYKQQFGNANAPAIYKSPDGFTLGRWHVAQKANYKRGILDKEKIKKLEKIGFLWKQH